jgi:hypothetical protein
VSFEQFICWDREALGLIETDAVDMPKAMFLATHQPMRVWSQEYGREARHLVTEDAVLEAFQEPRSAPLIMPIIGSSGSGKSHLVRWLRYSLPQRDDHLVIWVRRDRNSLADVVADLLDAIPTTDKALSASVDELREQLTQAAVVEMSEAELRRRLVQDLAHHIRRLSPASAPYDDAKAKERWSYLIKEDLGLPLLLDDQIFLAALIADGAVISRIAARIQRGRSGDQSGAEPLFTVDDLTPPISQSGKMNRDAEKLYKRLQRPHERPLAEIGCDIINHVLEQVMQSLLGFTDSYGRPSVNSIIVALRRLLARENKELVLLVEDLALLHGVQGQLLEALITPRTGEAIYEGGEDLGELCQVRAALAVTTNPWRQLEQQMATLRTRLAGWQTPLFDVDVSLDGGGGDDGDGVSADYTRRFVAGYLNAVRLGPQRLQKHLDAWEKDGDGPFEVPSACTGCPHLDECHPAFGAEVARGLYPFDTTAVERLARREARKANGRFDPREVLAGVQRMLDLALDEIPSAGFPDERVRDRFVDAELAMPEPIAQMLRRADAGSAARRRTLLELWGPRPFAVRNLDETIHQAFALPELDAAVVDGTTAFPDPGADGGQSSGTSKRKDEEQELINDQLAQIDLWGRGEGQLSDALAGVLRRYIFEGVMSRVDWELLSDGRSDVLLEDIGLPDAPRTVSIEASRGDERASRFGPPAFVVERNESGVRLLRALFLLNAHRSWNFDAATDGLLHAPHVLDQWAALVDERIAARSSQDHGLDIVALLRALAVSGRALGLDTSSENRVSALACAVAATPQEEPEKIRTPGWVKLERSAVGAGGEREVARETLVRRLGRSQGTGSSVALDIAELLPELDAFTTEWKIDKSAGDKDSPFRRWFDGLADSLEKAVEAEWEERTNWAQAIVEQLALDEGRSLIETADEVEATATVIDQVTGQQREEAALVLVLKELRSGDDAGVREMLDAFGEDGELPWPERFRRVAALDGAAAQSVTIAVTVLGRYLDEAEDVVTAQQKASGAGEALTKATSVVNEALAELDKAFEALGG